MRMMSCVALALVLAGTAQGQETGQGTGLSIELNTVDQVESGCQLSFLVTTDLPEGIEQIVVEAVIFDKAGSVDRLTLFDFGAIPQGRPRVRQFILSGTQCADLGNILINGIPTCTGPGLDAGACGNGLTLTSRTDVELLG